MSDDRVGGAEISNRLFRRLGLAAAAICLVLVVLRITDAARWIHGERIDHETLLFLMVPLVVLLLPMFGEITLGKDGVTLKQLKRELSETRDSVQATQERLEVYSSVLKRTPGGAPGRVPAQGAAEGSVAGAPADAPRWATEAELPPITALDDPQKGRWDGAPAKDHRRLSADVKPARGDDDYFQVRLRVESTDPVGDPLRGPVRFHLHDTFAPQMEQVTAVDGVATLELYAWGAFTVGAETDRGRTRLELDLVDVPGVPALFASR
jgi:hypothetical protein